MEKLCAPSWAVVVMFLLDLTSGGVVNRKCQCVPDQWQGVVVTIDREFDLSGGRTGSLEKNIYVTYDYKNKRFAMADLSTGNRAVADYNKGFKYVVKKDGCRGLRTNEHMRHMCLPAHASHLGEFTLGTQVPVELWQFSLPHNVTVKTTVMQNDCVPVTEEVAISEGSYVSLMTSTYLNVEIGIKDEDVFMVPKNCYKQPDERNQQQGFQKRHSDAAWSLMHLLRGNLPANAQNYY